METLQKDMYIDNSRKILKQIWMELFENSAEVWNWWPTNSRSLIIVCSDICYSEWYLWRFLKALKLMAHGKAQHNEGVKMKTLCKRYLCRLDYT